MLIQTGAELAAAGCNSSALKFFGLHWLHHNDWLGCLGKIREHGLPIHTCPNLEEIQDNDALLSSIFGREKTCAPRRLVMAFDRTYITSCAQLATTTKGHVLLGGPHRPTNFDQPSEAQLVLKSPDGTMTDVTLKRNRALASEMESCLVWDPTRKHSPSFEIASFPVQSSASRDSRYDSATDQGKRGNWDTVMRIGEVLDGASSVKHIIADNHGSHSWTCSWLMGHSVPLSDDLRSLVPWFRDLKFVDLPLCCMPIGARVAMHGQSSVHFWPGPAHSQKNFTEQMRNALRTIHFGNVFCDNSAALELGLFAPAFSGTDAMSDKQSALVLLVLGRSG